MTEMPRDSFSGIVFFLDLFYLGRGSMFSPLYSYLRLLDLAWELDHGASFGATHGRIQGAP